MDRKPESTATSTPDSRIGSERIVQLQISGGLSSDCHHQRALWRGRYRGKPSLRGYRHDTTPIAQEALQILVMIRILKIEMLAGEGHLWATSVEGWREAASQVGRRSWQSRDTSGDRYAPSAPRRGWCSGSAGKAYDAGHRRAAHDTARRAAASGRAAHTVKHLVGPELPTRGMM